MKWERGLAYLDNLLKEAGVTPDSDVYLDFVAWKRQLLDSIENERRFAGLSPQEQERRERILRELDRLALKYASASFMDLCTHRPVDALFEPSSLLHVPATQIEADEVGSFENAYALVIGIGAYQHLRPLRKTVVDARDMYDVLVSNEVCGYPPKHVKLLLDADATKGMISDRLDWLAQSTNKDSTAIIFFAGHGARRIGGFEPGEYLCPVEANWYDLRNTAISEEEFTKALKAIPARKLIVFFDACHSGGIGKPRKAGFQIKAGLSEATYDRLAQGKGRVIIASCGEDEVSWELQGMRNGLFTHYLLEALKGAAAIRDDGFVHIYDIAHYVQEKVPQRCPDQHPIFKTAVDSNFAIALAPRRLLK